MTIHIFRSGKEPDVFGFTADETGANLPADLGPWTRSVAGDEIDGGVASGISTEAASSGPAAAAIERDGYYVARSETIARDAGVPWVD